MSGTRIMKMSQWRRAVKNRHVFGSQLKALSDRSGDRSNDPISLKLDVMIGPTNRKNLLTVGL